MFGIFIGIIGGLAISSAAGVFVAIRFARVADSRQAESGRALPRYSETPESQRDTLPGSAPATLRSCESAREFGLDA